MVFKISESDKVYQIIKDLIIKNELISGSIISEKELQKKLNYGRTPIREALIRLHYQDWLVDIVKKKGIFVSNIKIEDIQIVFELRYALEELIGKLATARISDIQIKKIEKLIKENEGLKKLSYPNSIEFDYNFHNILVKATGNRFIKDIYDKLYNYSVRLLYLKYKNRYKFLDASHYKEILNALKNRNGEKTSNLLKKHVTDFCSSYFKNIFN
jgi:DNA-binding GntR family transcriptional regulator